MCCFSGRWTCALLLIAIVAFAADGDWASWRGPNSDGMARGDAPLKWSDSEHIAWKAAVPGRGFSSPVVWGNQVFLTTAVPTAGSGGLTEHQFKVMSFDRKTGKLAWEKTARTATPHQMHHPQYGSFASNSPITDGRRLYAFFGSRGLYCYTLAGQLVWQKDF